MTPIEAVPLITKNSHRLFSAKIPPVEAQLRVVPQVTTQMPLLRDLELSSHLEELEVSLDLENNSELWTITTVDHSISTSSPRP